MTYDLHGDWDATTGIVAPLYARSGESGTQRQLNVVRVFRELNTRSLHRVYGVSV